MGKLKVQLYVNPLKLLREDGTKVTSYFALHFPIGGVKENVIKKTEHVDHTIGINMQPNMVKSIVVALISL